MKEAFFKISFLVFIVSLAILGFTLSHKPDSKPLKQSVNPTPSPMIIQKREMRTLFIPYWKLSDEGLILTSPVGNESINELIYFGIAPNINGSINLNDQGYKKLDTFIKLSRKYSQKKYLTLRLIDDDINISILKDQKKQNKLINETVSLAKQNYFDGIVLDLEMSVLPTQKVIHDISIFVEIASIKAKSDNLSLSMTLYGDTFYRNRPYDIKELDKYIDYFYIMAYDLHKANGTPGPNFPLSGKEQYGYDYSLMIKHFTQNADPQKYNVVFGLYGYDWSVDENKKPLKRAKALTLLQIKANYIDSCTVEECVVRRDPLSSETEIQYVDSLGGLHIIWFEDESSIQKKIQTLEQNNISSYGFWAYAYY